MHIVSLGC